MDNQIKLLFAIGLTMGLGARIKASASTTIGADDMQWTINQITKTLVDLYHEAGGNPDILERHGVLKRLREDDPPWHVS